MAIHIKHPYRKKYLASFYIHEKKIIPIPRSDNFSIILLLLNQFMDIDIQQIWYSKANNSLKLI